MKRLVGNRLAATLGEGASAENLRGDALLKLSDDVGRNLLEPQMADRREEMDAPNTLVALESPAASCLATGLLEVGHEFIVEEADRHRPTSGEARHLRIILKSPEKPASLVPGFFYLLDGHVGTDLGRQVEAAPVAYPDLNDRSADPQARAIDLLQDVEVALPRAW
jgi:hypothetical protein